ncbi:MAG: amidohydrolase [Pseudomonadales bacterium]|nr:amidohydrolase [Pseudomonadales bacterium]
MPTFENESLIIDCQVHAYEQDRPERPWIGTLHGPKAVTGDDMVDAMDQVGVDGALLVSPWSMYRYDPSYALEVYAQHPSRFGLIRPFDPQSKNLPEQVSEWAATPGVVAARAMIMGHRATQAADAPDSGINQILSACAKHNLPVNILGWGNLDLLGELARRHPQTQLVIDHIGLQQPFEPPAPENPFNNIEQVIALAQFDNIAIKISGACTLSQQAFPYLDIWEPLGSIFDAYGLERCMWGTDWTRAVGFLSYQQGVDAFRVTDQLSDTEKSMLMGGSLARIYQWQPSTTTPVTLNPNKKVR